ncbi:MAG: hypothetical protein QM479_14445 [Pseudomonadota bacterium]
MSKLLDFFKSKPILDEESIVWLFESFFWANKNLDSATFYNKTALVLPSNEFFSGHSNNTTEMAGLIFEKVKQYAQLQHWPCRLFPQDNCQLEQPALPYIEGQLRGDKVIDHSRQQDQFFSILYNPAQVKNPQAMIAYYAQTLAYYLIMISPNKPDNIEENIGPLSEVIGVFMGFGVMLSNTAFNYKNVTCGSCRTISTDRNSYLSQYDITYALAIFCVLKDIPRNQALASIKTNLKFFFKKAYKQVLKRDEIKQLKMS